jgi:hypothetical protein
LSPEYTRLEDTIVAYPANFVFVGKLVGERVGDAGDVTGDLTVYVTGDVEIDVEKLRRICEKSMNRVR